MGCATTSIDPARGACIAARLRVREQDGLPGVPTVGTSGRPAVFTKAEIPALGIAIGVINAKNPIHAGAQAPIAEEGQPALNI